MKKPGRNDPCPCGSGKKFKKCCESQMLGGRFKAERVDQHIGALHAELHITPAQQAQWDQFAQVMRDNATAMDQLLEQRATSFASMNAAENMQSYAQIAQQHAQDTEKLATAFQAAM